MPEDIQQNIVQEVPVVDVPTQNVVQTIDPENPVYKFMKANKLTTLSEKDFVQKYSTPEKAKEIHSFMVANKLTTLKDSDFYGKYFTPPSSTITVTDETGLKKKVSASSDPALQNLLTFAKSGKNIGKPVDAKVTQQFFSDKNQILAPNLVVPTNTREAALANRKDNWNKLVEDASFRAVEKTVNKNSKQGVSYSREKIQRMVDDYKKRVNSGELIISEDPATGKDVLATPNYNPFSSLLSTYNKGNEQKYEDAYLEGLSLKEKIKHKEVQQYLAQDDDSIPERPAGFFGNLGGFGGQVINMLEKPIVYSIGLASGAGAAEAATLGTTALSTAGGLSNVGNTLGFMSDMANSSYSPTWDKVYYGNLQGVENPTEEQKLTAASKATEAANYSKSIGGAEGLIFGLPFGSFSKSLESSSKGFVDNLLANGKNTMKHAPQMVGTSIAGQIGKGEVGMKYGSGETQSEIIKEGLNTGVETAKFLATMSGLGVIKSAVPYAFTLLANTKESPSKSLTAKAKAVVSNFPDEVIADVYNQAEQNGIIEPGKTNDILNNIQKYREAEASVPSNVTNADARDAIAGKLEKLDKLDQEGKLTKVNARKIEIEKEKAEINKEIDNIYNGDDVLANEKDNAGYPLKERSEVGKTPVLEEETVIKETPKAEAKPVEEVKVTEEVKPTELGIEKQNIESKRKEELSKLPNNGIDYQSDLLTLKSKEADAIDAKYDAELKSLEKVKPTELKVETEKPSKEVVFTAYGTGDNGYVIEHAQGIEKKDVKRLEDARVVTNEQVGLNNEQKAELENTGSLITENKTLENGDKKITVHFKNRDAFGRKGGSRFDLVIPENNASTAEGIKKVVDNFYAENDVLGGKRLEGSKYIQEGVRRVQKYLDSNKAELKPIEIKTEVKPTETPRFPSYDDAQEWIKSKSKEYKSRNEFLLSQEYRDAYPDINALFKVERADYSKKGKEAMQESGVKIGDRVVYDYVTPIGAETYSGKIVDRQGVPFVMFDSGQKTISGKQSVRWHKGFIKESALKPKEEVKPTEVKEEITIEEEPTQSDIAKQQTIETDLLIGGQAAQRRKDNKYTKDGVEYIRNSKGNGVPSSVTGDVRFTNEVSLPFKYKLIEAKDLQPSHQDGIRNPNHFIPEAQPKNRNDAGSLMAENSFSSKPRFEELGENTNAYSGAPIVNERGEVVQGNNRAAGLRKGYDAKNKQYKNDLANNSSQFGFTKEQVEKMNEPILVREVAVSDEGAIEVGNYDVKDLETGGKRRLDPIAITRRMPFDIKGRIAEMLFTGEETLNQAIRANQKRVLELLNPYLNQAQRNTITKEGVLTDAGIKDLEDVVKQFLFDNGDTALPDLFENLSANQKEGLKKSLPYIFSTSPDKSIVPDIQEAILAVADFRDSGAGDFNAWLAQGDMFADGKTPRDKYTPLEIEIAKTLIEAKTQKEIVKKFGDYSDIVKDKEANMFDPAIAGKTRAEGIKEIFKTEDYAKPISERGGKTPSRKEELAAEPSPKPRAEKEKIAGKEAKKGVEEAYKDLTINQKRQIINSKFDELLKELKIEKICPT